MKKFEKEFRQAHPETIGETDKQFDDANYTEWLEKNAFLQSEDLTDFANKFNELIGFAVDSSGIPEFVDEYLKNKI